jgi:hypothetical protein
VGGQVYQGSGGNLWRVARKGRGWGEPTRLTELINRSTSVFSPSVEYLAGRNITVARCVSDQIK